MDRAGIVARFDFTDWGDHHLLDVAERLTPAQWTADADVTERGLRATLVHTLDVEWSWRLRLQKRPKAEWGPDVELWPADYPTVADLRAHWARDEQAMRAWIDSLDDRSLAADWNDRGAHTFPLWCFLVHIVTHRQQQRSNAALLLTQAGHSPGNIEFLDYAHAAGAR